MKKLSKLTQSITHLLTLLFGAVLFLICPRLMLNHQKKWAPFMHWDYAHRGLHDNMWGVPENSMPAFKAAVDKGYGIELDVHLTVDNELVVHHDDTLYRMCHVERDIKDMTLKEIRQYTLLSTDEKIPTLQEVLDLVDGRVPLLIELKTEAHTCSRLCRIFSKTMRSYNGKYILESFNPLALRWFRKNEPQILRGQLSCNFFKEKPHCDLVLFMITVLASNFLSRPDFISYKYTDYKNPMVRINCLLFKARLALWTINTMDAYDAVRNNADMIIFEGFEP
ncbi:glycerophosphodiester phosphodiesterase [Frisingicoccus sp.]|uniref:glycerophosphodiester phosphodiesterase n=1 Tax=Frisingicoccus sp. TaxID=1918627 RepID=UPI003AB2F919